MNTTTTSATPQSTTSVSKLFARGATICGNKVEHWDPDSGLEAPLRWRKPRSAQPITDLFHKEVPFEFIDRVFAVMALCPQHTFQILTKRPERMAEYFNSFQDWTEVDGVVGIERLGVAAGQMLDGGWIWGPGKRHRQAIQDFISDAYNWYDEETEREPKPIAWPLPNVWLGTSVEDQDAADERIPHLLRCPAAVRFLSCEPLLGDVELIDYFGDSDAAAKNHEAKCKWGTVGDLDDDEGKTVGKLCSCEWMGFDGEPRIHWVIVGGESGPGARPCNIDWIRSIVRQCRDAGVPCFVKQLGAIPKMREREWFERFRPDDLAGWTEADGLQRLELRDKKGGDINEWPADLRVREMPEVARGD